MHPRKLQQFIALLFALALMGTLTGSSLAADKPAAKPPSKAKSKGMNNVKLDQLIRRIDKNVDGAPGFWKLQVEGKQVVVITDEKADRMRIISAVAKAEDLKPEIMHRLLQANFDSALDARYSIAKGALWSAFIHPLSTLNDAEFLSGLGQVVNLTETFGTSYSSGALVFNGGDSAADFKRRELIDKLIKKGLSI